MPPTGYLSVQGVRQAIQHLANTYPALVTEVELPEHSVENRKIYALKIGSGAGTDRRGVLFLGGTHARELINPDLLVALALKLCDAYTNGAGLTFGGRTYEPGTIKLLVEALDIWMIPLVNPDGRDFVQKNNGDPWWRKNRAANNGQPCKGVDLNRNLDFLWSSGLGTSADSCSDVYKGPNAFSEPESRNVRHMLDTYSNIAFMADVHSYSELILHPWGDDDDQTTDPSMNFQNPAFNGVRGTTGDAVYKEYIDADDLEWFVDTGIAVRDAISAVRGRVYTAEQSILLYPTTGTNHDYAYARHLVTAGRRKVFAYTIETGTEFQPPYSEALQVMDEVSSGLIQFCIAGLCAVQTLVTGTALAASTGTMRAFRDDHMRATPAGRRHIARLNRHSRELLEIVNKDERLRARLLDALERVTALTDDEDGGVVDGKLVAELDDVAEELAEHAGDKLRRSIKDLRKELREAEGKKVRDALGPRDDR